MRGLVAVPFGLLVIIWPDLAVTTLPLLITLLGAYILIDAIVTSSLGRGLPEATSRSLTEHAWIELHTPQDQ